MLNPSLNHRSASRVATLIVCAVTTAVTLPLAAMRAPEEGSEVLTLPAVLATASAPVPSPPALAAATVAPKRALARKPTPPPEPGPAQGLADGSLFGGVYDSSGAAVPGVTVTVLAIERNNGVGVRENVVATDTSGETGGFQFRALTPGEYSLRAELRGFATYRKDGLRIVSSQTLKENVTLFVGNVVQRVEVVTTGQPKPPTPAGTPQRIRVGGNVVASRLISQVRPIYPQSARDAGIEGTVHLQGFIAKDGTLMALRVLSTNDRDLTAAALEAARQWRYQPALLNGEPIEVLTEIDVDFRLSQ